MSALCEPCHHLMSLGKKPKGLRPSSAAAANSAASGDIRKATVKAPASFKAGKTGARQPTRKASLPPKLTASFVMGVQRRPGKAAAAKAAAEKAAADEKGKRTAEKVEQETEALRKQQQERLIAVGRTYAAQEQLETLRQQKRQQERDAENVESAVHTLSPIHN